MNTQRSPFHQVPQVFGLTLFLLVALVPDAMAAGVVFQWTDADGGIHFTDDPGKIPKDFRDTAQEIRRPDEPKDPPSANPESESQPETQKKPASKSARPSISPSEAVDSHGHNREWWQQRIQNWQAKKADAQAKLADAQERLGLERFREPMPDSMQRKQGITDEISTYEKQIREADIMLTVDLPEEARKANAPPGWLRE
ncbi:MAG: DUF4124 domain-containing protein [Nitrospirae bacterium]|nr:DUF4124 domain-containing protein [Nitrospirota bacterium]